jgi:predicted tellurium resistance membrane protein TerC
MLMRLLKIWTFILAVCAVIIGFVGIVFLLHDYRVFLYPYVRAYPEENLVYLMFAGFIVTAIAGWLMIMTLILEKKRS